jgi:hypothetical protein
MIGREKTGNNCPHRAEGIEHSVRPFYTMPFACLPQAGAMRHAIQ